MNPTTSTRLFALQPVRVILKVAHETRSMRAFVEDDGDFDPAEHEIKRMIELSGMVSPQFEALEADLFD